MHMYIMNKTDMESFDTFIVSCVYFILSLLTMARLGPGAPLYNGTPNDHASYEEIREKKKLGSPI